MNELLRTYLCDQIVTCYTDDVICHNLKSDKANDLKLFYVNQLEPNRRTCEDPVHGTSDILDMAFITPGLSSRDISFYCKSLAVGYDIEMFIFPFLVYNDAFLTRMATLPWVPLNLSVLYMSYILMQKFLLTLSAKTLGYFGFFFGSLVM